MSPLLRAPLTELRFGLPTRWTGSFTSFLDALSGLPTLEVLEFEEIVVSSRSQEDAWGKLPRRISLPNLRRLSWTGKLQPDSGFPILRHLMFSVFTSIYFRAVISRPRPAWPRPANTYPSFLSEAVALCTGLQSLAHEPGRTLYRTVFFGQSLGDAGLTARFVAETSASDTNLYASDIGAMQPGSLDFGFATYGDPAHEAIAHLLISPPPFAGQISALYFPHWRLFYPGLLSFFKSALHQFYGVSAVFAEGVATRHLLHYLAGRHAGRFFCDLETLTISGGELRALADSIDEENENTFADRHPDSMRAMDTTLNCLEAALRARGAQGAPIRRLIIAKSTAEEVVKEILRALIEYFEWKE
ncbi:hypothetical protein K488DRAFT_88635 [Vararia minispora EC-137]|uniref:Uncharacterized protein n=1 Tax=Vararia minispora EC-137 TaxID=1314806 RepID=A0ACB8QCK3_9AGAM|nr:hypothetical protein K488DRAFT_88635 [Vararia minispora EC-137]